MTSSSSAIVQTPSTVKVRELMESAISAPNPLEFHFTVARYGSLSAAKSKAVAFRNQFHSIRARARNSFQLAAGMKIAEFTGEQIKGRFDVLFCDTNILPNDTGYMIRIGTAIEDEFEIYDSVTKERILVNDPKDARIEYLMNIFIEKAYNPAIFPPYFTPEQEQEMFGLDFDLAKRMYEECGVKLPTWVGAQSTPAAEAAPDFDLVDVPMDEFGVGVEEG